MKSLSLVLVSLLINFSLFAAEPLVQIVTEEAYPLAYLDPDDSKIKGIGTEIIREVMDIAGLQYTVKILPWTRAYQNTINIPNTLIYSLARIPERDKQFIWLEKFYHLEYSIYAINKNLTNLSLENIKTKSIAVLRNDVSHISLLHQGFTKFVFINDRNHAIQLLERGRVDLMFASAYFVKILNSKALSTIILQDIKDFKNLKFYLYFAMNLNSDPELVNKIRNGFKLAKEQGNFNKLVKSLHTN